MCIKEQVNSEGSISCDNDVSVNKEQCVSENRGVDMTVEYASRSSNGISGLSEDTLLDGSKNRMVFFLGFFLRGVHKKILQRNVL